MEKERKNEMRALMKEIRRFAPWNDQEENDKRLILAFLEAHPDALERSNETAHVTASAWVLNHAGDRVLMAYHNLYDSWSWTGGHADGEADILAAAIREVEEETGLERPAPLTKGIFSLEILPVMGHVKGGRYVSTHLHLNLTYLLQATGSETLRSNPLENAQVAWMAPEEAVEASTEPWMREVYRKLNRKLEE